MLNIFFNLSKKIISNVNNIYKKSSDNKEKDKSECKVEDDTIKFAPNSIVSRNSLECGLKCHANKVEDQKFNISFECDVNTKLQIDKVCRFFEIDQNTAFQRGLWMLNVVIEAEITDRKVGIVSLDKEAVVTDITPISFV